MEMEKLLKSAKGREGSAQVKRESNEHLNRAELPK